MKVTVVYAAPGIEAVQGLDLAAGATVGEAVAASGLGQRLAMPPAISFAIHGQRASPDTPLAEGDRVEILRPLVADPKSARRARAVGHPLPPTRKVKRSGT